jgi:sensor histidine kinase YesM
LWDWRVWAVLSAVTITMGMLAVANDSLMWLFTGQSPTLNLKYWRIWISMLHSIPVGVLTWYFAERLQARRLNWTQTVLVHAVAILVLYSLRFVLLWLSVWFALSNGQTFAILAPDGSIQRVEAWSTFLLFWRMGFPGGWLQYWAIIAVQYALRFQSESQQRLRESAELRSRLVEARLDALRSQLNPHFIYNVLNSVSVLAQKNEPGKVTEIVGRLASMLRIALDDTRPDCIPLSQELRFIEGYLDIERVRFADRLVVRMEISRDATTALVPAMILQPLVENAIKHGVAASTQPTTITITGERHGDTLRLCVSDSGPGFGRRDYSSTVRQVGMSTTQDRLEELYGSHQRFGISDTPGGGATVTIEIPYTAATVPQPQAEPVTVAQSSRAARSA